MIDVRYPSTLSYDAEIHGVGDCLVDSPTSCVFFLHQSGQYILYGSYRGTGAGLVLSFSVSNPSITGVWFPLIDLSTMEPVVLEIPLLDDGGAELQNFRIPICEASAPLYILPTEDYLNVSIYGGTVSTPADLEGEMSLNLLSGIRPYELPYSLSSSIERKYGSLTLTLVGGTSPTWKVVSESTYHASGYKKQLLGIGNQKIEVKWSNLSPDVLYYDITVNEGENIQSLSL